MGGDTCYKRRWSCNVVGHSHPLISGSSLQFVDILALSLQRLTYLEPDDWHSEGPPLSLIKFRGEGETRDREKSKVRG